MFDKVSHPLCIISRYPDGAYCQPANAAIPQNEIRRQQAELTQRIDRIREHLVIENKTNQGQNPEKIAQWYNWPNWPNWNNWNNWRNY